MTKINNILLVDDDNITNFINQRLIVKLNVSNKIHIVTNGYEALEYIEECCRTNNNCCPELIFLDIKIPVMDGFEFLEKYTSLEFENKNSVIIFLLSTTVNISDLKNAKEYNISGFINKPLTEEKIKEIFQKNIGS